MAKKNEEKKRTDQKVEEEPTRKGWKGDGNPKLDGPNRPST
ncbi:hypothetical protein HNQ94_000690 [Salirhabdus euzebyi]|uniref:Uncharacterized protein n=1 Tax=Salirhabdus euzebyi TaxID=394506 RepID=A0A841Q272_9BACI|nr:hypothetical protein [Salirhabdus euzebyi]MBB6452245.1 hypothetical protein [Salirhabdus euzebyi]